MLRKCMYDTYKLAEGTNPNSRRVQCSAGILKTTSGHVGKSSKQKSIRDKEEIKCVDSVQKNTYNNRKSYAHMS